MELMEILGNLGEDQQRAADLNSTGGDLTFGDHSDRWLFLSIRHRGKSFEECRIDLGQFVFVPTYPIDEQLHGVGIRMS